MKRTASIAELRHAGATFDADEAVAIGQQLINTLRPRHDADEGHPPYGPPSEDNVFLNVDGSVSCRGCKTTPAVSEVGMFVHALLPQESPRVAGGLHYRISCALLNVDVPLVDSLDAFSRDLARHEHGVRADVVRRVLARSVPPRSRTPAAAAACLAAGLALLATGESVRSQNLIAAMQTVPFAAETTTTVGPRVVPVQVALPERHTPSRPTRLHARRISMTGVTPPAAVMTVRSPLEFRAPSRGVFDRLRLGWLRDAFSFHSEL